MTVLEPNLKSIVAPVSPENFLQNYWTRQSLFARGDPGRLRTLLDDLGSLELTALLAQSHGLQIWCETSREAPVLPPSFDRALDAYYNRGATLYFHLREHTRARRWVTALARELGQPDLGAQFSIFAVRAGHGSVLHYDRNENFTIQLKGTKCWKVHANDFAKWPESNWFLDGPPPLYCDPEKIPKEMPADATEYVLQPGSMLYVPRGHLHYATATGEESLSCNLMFPVLLWGEALLRVLRARLLASESLRKAIIGGFGSGWNRSECLVELEEAVAILRKCVAEIEPQMLARMMIEPQTRGLEAYARRES
jgi:50S ribosomal protein L16 3-hydroxylase